MTEAGDNRSSSTASGAPSAPPPYAGSPWAAPAPRPVPSKPWRHRGGGVGLGVVLIVLGVVFLASQFIPGVGWWQLWPLILIAIGFVQMITPDHEDGWGVHRIFDGIGTILIGLVLLGNTTGYVAWSVWWVLLTLWPVLLIALGLNVLGRGLHQSWLRALAPVAIWAALAYAAAASFTGAGGLQPIALQMQPIGRAFSFSEPSGVASAATLNFKGGAGDIAITGGSDLVRATGTSPFGTPTFSVTRSADTADVALSLGEDHVAVAPGFGAGHADVALSDTAVWDATLETGASNLDADLSNVHIKHLALTTGVGSVSLKLGEVPDGLSGSDVSVKAGVSSVTILVPRGVEARVDTHNGLTGTSFSQRFEPQPGGAWQTPGYEGAIRVWHISIESGVGSVSVQDY